MNVPEESDSGVLPMNHSNKVEQSMAESEEGRPLIKENIHQSSTRPTQSGADVSQGLAGVRKVARDHKEMKFTAWLHQVTVDQLRDSFTPLKPKCAPGGDGMTWQAYEAGLEGRLADLHSRVLRGAYRALPSRRVYIEKGDGRKRPLGIAALEDKIVQHAVVTILNHIYEEDFLGFSYGFRPGRSQHQALDALSYALVKRKVNYVLDADIQGFFDNLDKAWMIKFVEQNRKRRGEGKPETFDFLGFTHISGKNGNGSFAVRRMTVRKRMRKKLQDIKQQLRIRMHDPVPETGAWLRSVVQGYFNYYAVPGNLDSMGLFRERVLRYWGQALKRH